jgi:hypothetical protein
MHDQSASRMNGRTRAAVFALCVRRVLITILKSAGIFTRAKVDRYKRREIPSVKCFVMAAREILAHAQFSMRPDAKSVRDISGSPELVEVGRSTVIREDAEPARLRS